MKTIFGNLFNKNKEVEHDDEAVEKQEEIISQKEKIASLGKHYRGY